MNNNYVDIFVIIFVFGLFAVPTMFKLAARRKQPQSKQVSEKVIEQTVKVEAQKIVFRPWLIDVTPVLLKVFDFSEGKVEGRLIIRGEKTVKRLLMLWKEEKDGTYKHKSILLEPILSQNLDMTTSQSLDEVREIANKMFGKKNKHKVTGMLQVKAPAIVSMPKAVVEPIKPEKPVLKGFKSSVTGILLKAGIEPHVTTRNGEAEQYTTFTATINADGETVCVKGNDIRRALADVDAQVGNKITLVHVRDEALSGDKTRKVYACSVLH
jgi:hypothetical protein